MSSRSLQRWYGQRATQLDELIQAHAAIGGTARGRRYATQQVNQAYAMMLSSQFQGFCRDLHSESVDFLVSTVQPVSMQHVLRNALLLSRKIDRGNPNPGNLGSDFTRLGLIFWDEVYKLDRRNKERKKALEELNEWRNAIAHQDFDPAVLGGRNTLLLHDVKGWRAACDQLAQSFDRLLARHILQLVGVTPW
jgi:hypothetical protein